MKVKPNKVDKIAVIAITQLVVNIMIIEPINSVTELIKVAKL